MTQPDRTFDKISLYGSLEWTAAALGITKDRLYRYRAKWERDAGFPTPDPITKHYIKADVLAWVNRRRRVADPLRDGVKLEPSATQKVNLDEL